MNFINNLATKSQRERVSSAEIVYFDEMSKIEEAVDSDTAKTAFMFKAVLAGEKPMLKTAIAQDSLRKLQEAGITLSREILTAYGVDAESEKSRKTTDDNIRFELTPTRGESYVTIRADSGFQEAVNAFKNAFPDARFNRIIKRWVAPVEVEMIEGWCREKNYKVSIKKLTG